MMTSRTRRTTAFQRSRMIVPALIGVASVLAGSAASTVASAAPAEPHLAPTATSSEDLIVRAAPGQLAQVTAELDEFGATITRTLPIINAVAVEVAAGHRDEIAAVPGVIVAVPDQMLTPMDAATNNATPKKAEKAKTARKASAKKAKKASAVAKAGAARKAAKNAGTAKAAAKKAAATTPTTSPVEVVEAPALKPASEVPALETSNVTPAPAVAPDSVESAPETISGTIPVVSAVDVVNVVEVPATATPTAPSAPSAPATPKVTAVTTPTEINDFADDSADYTEEAMPGEDRVELDVRLAAEAAEDDIERVEDEYNGSQDPGSVESIARVTGARRLWRQGITGAGVDVALIDTGIAPVAGAPTFVNGADLSLDSNAANVRFLDGYGHGTHMAGIIAGRDSSVTDPVKARGKFVGIAPDARLVNVKVGAMDGTVHTSQVVAALDWVVQNKNANGMNIRVVNLSYGAPASPNWRLDPLAWAAEVATTRGIVVVAAAGNEGAGYELASPAYSPQILAVGATDIEIQKGRRNHYTVAPYTSTGTRRRPDVFVPGSHVASLRVKGSYVDTFKATANINDQLTRGSGTSQATAVTSGLAALLVQAFPSATPGQIRSLMVRSTKSGNGHRDVTGIESLVDVKRAYRIGKVKLPVVAAVNPFAGCGPTWCRGAGDGTNPALVEWAKAAWNGTGWTGTGWTGTGWTGTGWTGSGWTGTAWTGTGWTGTGWTGTAWTSSQWTGSGWSGTGWSGSGWSGSGWSGTGWSGSGWSGSGWTGTGWSGTGWSGSGWSGTGWSGTAWSTSWTA
jgi:serine protease AprX